MYGRPISDEEFIQRTAIEENKTVEVVREELYSGREKQDKGIQTPRAYEI